MFDEDGVFIHRALFWDSDSIVIEEFMKTNFWTIFDARAVCKRKKANK